MKTRLFPALALAAAVTLGASGCSLISDQATLYEYAPSDGVNATTGQVDIRNAILVAGQQDGLYNLVFTAMNNSEQAENLSVVIVVDGVTTTADIKIPSGLSSFGDAAADQELIVFEDLETIPGEGVEAYFQAGAGDESNTFLPTIDAEFLKEYTPFVLDAAPASSEIE